MSAVAQPAIVDFLKTYSGLMGTKVNSRIGYSHKLYAIQRDRRQNWIENKGFKLQHVQYGQVGITADTDAEYTATDNAAYPEAIKANSTTDYGGSSSGDSAYDNKNNVDPPMDELDFAQSEIGYGIVQKSFKTKPISVESLRASADPVDQVNELVKLLTDYSKETISRIAQDEHVRVSGNRFIVTGTAAAPTFTENSDVYECYTSNDAARWNKYGFAATTSAPNPYDIAGTIDSPNQEDVSAITWGHLDDIYTRALRDGLGDYEMTLAQGMPVLYLVTDIITANRLLRDADSGLRTDIRESSEANSLLSPLGVTQTIRGWVILAEPWTRRFVSSGDTADSSGGDNVGTWLEKHYYSASATSRTKNSEWASAPYGESYVCTPAAFNSYVPRPAYTGQGAAEFTPQNFAGDYEFYVDRNLENNPFGSHGVFLGKFGCGTLAVEPTLLYTLRHTLGAIGS